MYENSIKSRQDGEKYEYFVYGDDYYKSRNTAIMERKKFVYIGLDKAMENPFGANHLLPSGHFRKIVDQKVMYLLGNGVKFNDSKEKDILNQYFETSFDEFLMDSGLDASKKSECWALAFMLDGKIRFTLIPVEQLTPLFDEYGRLSKMIRIYEDENDDDQEVDVMLVYDDKQVIRYEKKHSETKWGDGIERGHWTEQKSFNGQPVGDPVEHSFGQVPFFVLYNNRDHLSDLYPIKPLIDIYDIINSDFANNIDDMQDAFYTLKGFSGDSKALKEFMQQLKKIKAVPVSEDGEVKANQLEIPVEARRTFLELIKQDIYSFAMAVDLKGFTGGSITNVYIKAMYSDLDLKCNQFESEVRKYINAIIDFVNKTTSQTLEKDYNFVRSMIINDNERIEGIVKLTGIVSQETQRELLPYDIDMAQETKRLEKENTGINLGDGVVNQG